MSRGVWISVSGGWHSDELYYPPCGWNPQTGNMDMMFCSIVLVFFFFPPVILSSDPHKSYSVSYCIFTITLWTRKGFPHGLVVKDLPAKARDGGDVSLSHESRISSGVGKGNPPQYFCLGNPVDRGVWWASVHWGSVQFSSVAQSCPTLCNPMNHSTPGLAVHHQLPEFSQTHVHRVSDAIQPSNPPLSPSPPVPNPSQHQRIFQ